MKALKVSPAQRRLLDALATGVYGKRPREDRYLWRSLQPCQDMGLITYEGLPGEGRWTLTSHGRQAREGQPDIDAKADVSGIRVRLDSFTVSLGTRRAIAAHYGQPGNADEQTIQRFCAAALEGAFQAIGVVRGSK